MPDTAGGLCRGAKGHKASIVASTSGVIRVGSEK